jgi:peptide/nickel transport system substrate-binding protein
MLVNSVFTLWEGNMEIHELVPEYWKKIGIQVVVKPTSRALWNSQVTAAEHDIASYGATFGVAGEPCTSYSALFPFDNTCCFAPLWGLWFNSRGKEGEEPPQAAKELMKIYEEMKAEPSRDKRNALAKKAFAIHAENLWMIGIVTPSYKIVYRLAKNELRNESADWWIYEYNYITSQFFIKQGNSSSSGQ